jgi:hypothetical protein
MNWSDSEQCSRHFITSAQRRRARAGRCDAIAPSIGIFEGTHHSVLAMLLMLLVSLMVLLMTPFIRPFRGRGYSGRT